MLVMLNACYKNNCEYPLYSDGTSDEREYSPQQVLWHLSIYKVADKYDIPQLVQVSIKQAASLLKGALADHKKRDAITSEMVANVGLREILGYVYEVSGHRVPQDKDHLRWTFTNLLSQQSQTRLLNTAKRGLFHAEVRKIAQDIPQFAQDLFLFLTCPLPGTAPEQPRLIALVEEVHCPRPTCNGMQWKTTPLVRSACQTCGAQIDWKARTVLPGPIQ
jgi:hypothetical protein